VRPSTWPARIRSELCWSRTVIRQDALGVTGRVR
jgi:hypothetical protein